MPTSTLPRPALTAEALGSTGLARDLGLADHEWLARRVAEGRVIKSTALPGGAGRSRAERMVAMQSASNPTVDDDPG
jgi:hypothetical protein